MIEQTEALRLAERLTMTDYYEFDASLHCPRAAAELRRQHARIAELEAENAVLWKEREEPHRKIELYVRECNRIEAERDAANDRIAELEKYNEAFAQRQEWWNQKMVQLESQLATARADEREACARVCEARALQWRVMPVPPMLGYSEEFEKAAAAIRARKD